MKIIGKSESTIVGNLINTKDVYYCELDGVYTAFKFKNFKVKFTTTKHRRKYAVDIELTILCAFDGKEHKIVFGENVMYDGGLEDKTSNGWFKYYISKEDVKNGKESTLADWRIYEEIDKIIKNFGMFSCWEWDSVKAVKASWFGSMPSSFIGVNLAEYDLLTDTLTSPTEEILRFYEERTNGQPQLIYLLRCDCENESIINIYEFD